MPARLAGRDETGLRVGKVINQYKVGKHFELAIGDRTFTFARKLDCIATEAVLDGIYIIRTSVSAAQMDAPQCVRNYKSLANVERAFRALKTIDLKSHLQGRGAAPAASGRPTARRSPRRDTRSRFEATRVPQNPTCATSNLSTCGHWLERPRLKSIRQAPTDTSVLPVLTVNSSSGSSTRDSLSRTADFAGTRSRKTPV